jgi:hypothetical protein
MLAAQGLRAWCRIGVVALLVLTVAGPACRGPTLLAGSGNSWKIAPRSR